MKGLCIEAIFLICFSGLSASSIDEHLNIKSATALAASSGKNIFIKYEADWCLPCQIMNESVFADQNVQDLLKNEFIFITADFNQEKDREWYLKYNVTSLPTMAIIALDSSMIYKTSGSFTTQSFLDKFNHFSNNDHIISLTQHNKIMKDEKFKQIASATKLRSENTIRSIPAIEKNYTVTVGAFAFKQNALNYQKELIRRFGEDVFIIEDPTNRLFRLNIGQFEHRTAGQQLVRDLKKAGVDCYIRKF